MACLSPNSSEYDDIQAHNHAAVVSYLRSGAHGGTSDGLLGVEVEHFALFNDGSPVTYDGMKTTRDAMSTARGSAGGACDKSATAYGIRDLLEELAESYPEREYTAANDLVGLSNETGTITLEPAAQIEISLAPYCSITDIDKAYQLFYTQLSNILAKHDAHPENVGYHPTRKAFDLPLIPKERYHLMNEYFVNHVRLHGERMMRGSASLQVSVDYANEADGIRKLRIASALSPILAAIADNTRIFEAEENGTPIRRLDMWRYVSPGNCGIVPGVFQDGFGFAGYASWVLDNVPIFITRPAIHAVYNQAAKEAYADAPMSTHDIAHLLSMFWPDVRLKRVVEIRPADCIPPTCIAGYAALIKGLFYSETSRAAIENMLGVSGDIWPIDENSVEEARMSIERFGFDATPYGIALKDWEEELFRLARKALAAGERSYLDPLEAFACEKPWWQPNGALPRNN